MIFDADVMGRISFNEAIGLIAMRFQDRMPESILNYCRLCVDVIDGVKRSAAG